MKNVLVLLVAVVLPLAAAPLSGTKSIGPAGDYASISAAIADVQTQTLSGPLVLELQPGYLSNVETFPLVFSNLSTTAANTLTLRPQSGATGLSISSIDTTAATLDLNGAQFLAIDGRPGGVGTAKQLTIGNTASGRAVRFINEASNNALRHLTLQSANTGANNGTVVFGTTSGANGNDNNLIDSCDLRDGVSTPRNGIYASGSTTDAARSNSGNTISNCNIYNFHGGDSTGVRLAFGNSDWTITGNSFYQEVARPAGSGTVRAIHINNTSGNNFTISGNFIGGSAPNAGGAPWTTTGTASNLFQGIRLNVGTITPSSVRGNTIANMVWTGLIAASTLPGLWSGIYLEAGAAGIGPGNTIGNGTGTGSIVVSLSGSGGTTFGIGSAAPERWSLTTTPLARLRRATRPPEPPPSSVSRSPEARTPFPITSSAAPTLPTASTHPTPLPPRACSR